METNTAKLSVVTSEPLIPGKGLKVTLTDYVKFALCASPIAALIAFAIYCLFIEI